MRFARSFLLAGALVLVACGGEHASDGARRHRQTAPRALRIDPALTERLRALGYAP
jgi:hypothetical protein